jgi:hypothetical protein
MKQAWIQPRKFGRGYTVRIGGGLLDLEGVTTLARAVALARRDRAVTRVYLPIIPTAGTKEGTP